MYQVNLCMKSILHLSHTCMVVQ